MRTRILTSLLLSLAVASVWADGIVTDEITLQDGTIYEGYISSQVPTKSFTIAASRTVKRVPAEKVQNLSQLEISIEDLSDTWKKWAEKNLDKMLIRGKKKYLLLSSFDLQNSSSAISNYSKDLNGTEDSIAINFDSLSVALRSLEGVKSVENVLHVSNVFILQEGSTIEFLDLQKQYITVGQEEVVSIKPLPEPDSLLTGFTSVLELNSGNTVSGKIIETLPGKTIYIKTEQGNIQACNMTSIRKNLKEKKYEKQGYWEQAQLLETVTLTDGRILEGVIVEQRYGIGKTSSSIVIANVYGERIIVENSKIARLDRKQNPDYRPLYKLTIKTGYVFANQEQLTKAECSKEKKRIRIVPTHINTIQRQQNGSIVIQTHQDSQMEQLLFVRLYVTIKNGEAYYLDTDDLLTNAIPVTEKEIRGDTSYWVFRPDSGFYTIYLPTIGTAYFCNIQ